MKKRAEALAAAEAARTDAKTAEESRTKMEAVMAVDQEKLDQVRAEAVAEMQAKVDKAARDKAEERRKTAEAALAVANAKLEASTRAEKKSVITSNGDLAACGFLFEQTQEAINKMRGLLLKVRGREDSSKAAGMQKALSALAGLIGQAAEV